MRVAHFPERFLANEEDLVQDPRDEARMRESVSSLESLKQQKRDKIRFHGPESINPRCLKDKSD